MPVLGVRDWLVADDGTLCSVAMAGDHWRKREAGKAECRAEEFGCLVIGSHDAPGEGCGCGWWAFYDREACEELGYGADGMNRARGVVSAWGEVVEHEMGFRAEYMRLEAVIMETEEATVLGSRVSLEAAHRELAERYGVPLIIPAEVESFLRELGGTVLERRVVGTEFEPSPRAANLFANNYVASSPSYPKWLSAPPPVPRTPTSAKSGTVSVGGVEVSGWHVGANGEILQHGTLRVGGKQLYPPTLGSIAAAVFWRLWTPFMAFMLALNVAAAASNLALGGNPWSVPFYAAGALIAAWCLFANSMLRRWRGWRG